MRLTAFTDYSLRVLIHLAAQPERRVTIAEISEAFDIKPNHLTKVVHHLGRRGWVETTRGKGGGLRLAKPADDICVGDVVRDTEGQARPAECFEPGRSTCAIARCCRLKGMLEHAVKAFYAVLDGCTLEDIARDRHALSVILHRPGAQAARATARALAS